jgi:hypothetical protein
LFIRVFLSALRNALEDARHYDHLAASAASEGSRDHFQRKAEPQRQQAACYQECLETLEQLAAADEPQLQLGVA